MTRFIGRDQLGQILDFGELEWDDVYDGGNSAYRHASTGEGGRDGCLAIVGGPRTLSAFLLSAGAVLDYDHAAELFLGLASDSLATRSVYYWPSTAIGESDGS